MEEKEREIETGRETRDERSLVTITVYEICQSHTKDMSCDWPISNKDTLILYMTTVVKIYIYQLFLRIR